MKTKYSPEKAEAVFRETELRLREIGCECYVLACLSPAGEGAKITAPSGGQAVIQNATAIIRATLNEYKAMEGYFRQGMVEQMLQAMGVETKGLALVNFSDFMGRLDEALSSARAKGDKERVHILSDLKRYMQTTGKSVYETIVGPAEASEGDTLH